LPFYIPSSDSLPVLLSPSRHLTASSFLCHSNRWSKAK
jgi:hypothetical protein